MVPILDVYDSSSGADVLVGRARFTLRHGAISTVFTYDENYLAQSHAYAIDPSLPLDNASAHCAGIPGAFRDSAPDRWGRHLIARERESDAIETGTVLHQLDEVDYLIGVFDRTREGSLRYKEPHSVFLAESNPVPPLLQLPELLAASRAATKDEAGRAQIKELLDAGSGSLGGARPKASVREDDRLLLAKFSHPHDTWNVMAWEKTALDMAADAGISVPASRLVRIGDENVLLLKRFDRQGSLADGVRIPYMSAMTALQSSDGSGRDYVELAEEAAYLTGDSKTALAELFTRLAFFIGINNVDDHMRNWGFLRKHDSWCFAPLFDVNPDPALGAARVTTIVGQAREKEADALWEFAAYVGLADAQAQEVIESVLHTITRWDQYAAKNGCPERERKLFAPMFAQKQTELARLVR